MDDEELTGEGSPDGPRDQLLRAGVQRRQGRQPEGRCAIACKTETGALRTAERLAPSKLGVAAFSSTGDAEMGDYDDEPTVFFRNGRFPPAFE